MDQLGSTLWTKFHVSSFLIPALRTDNLRLFPVSDRNVLPEIRPEGHMMPAVKPAFFVFKLLDDLPKDLRVLILFKPAHMDSFPNKKALRISPKGFLVGKTCRLMLSHIASPVLCRFFGSPLLFSLSSSVHNQSPIHGI